MMSFDLFRIYSSSLLILLYVSAGYAQTLFEVSLPVAADATVSSLDAASNYGNHPDLIALAWEANETPFALRSFFEFELGELPGEPLVEAELHLFATTGSGHPGHYGLNQALLCRTTASWSEHDVSWADQPATTISNAVFVAQSTTADENYTIDVTNLVEEAILAGESHVGLALQLQSEDVYRCMNFASSNHPDTELHPTLVLRFGTTTSIDEPIDEPVVETPDAPVEEAPALHLYPNPVGQTTSLAFHLESAETVSVGIVDAAGRIIEKLAPQQLPAGDRILEIGTDGWPSGRLFLQVITATGHSWSSALWKP